MEGLWDGWEPGSEDEVEIDGAKLRDGRNVI